MQKGILTFLITILSIIILPSCTQNNCNEQLVEVEEKYRDSILSFQDSVASLNSQLQKAKERINVLEYPADQRLYNIQTLFDNHEYDSARIKIAELKTVFPNAKEIKDCDLILSKIESFEAAKKAEEERLKALGFKAFKDNPKVTHDDVTYSYSGFSFGRTFTFEYVYDVDEYSYTVADKDCTYILASLTISTKKHYAYPQFVGVYEIIDGKLKNISNFRTEYASYNTYGASIGNYSETSHDFSKVSSVKYKMAAEIPMSYTKKPLLILTKKTNNTSSGLLTIEDVRDNYEVIKILNRNNLK
jgi:hypothetical protein